MKRTILLLILLLIAAGCGGGGSGGGSSSTTTSRAPSYGDLVIKQTLQARMVPSDVDTVRIYGMASNFRDGILYTDGGGIVYGPVEKPKAAEYTLQQVPTSVNWIKLEYLSAGNVVALYYQEVTITPDAPYVITDPQIVQIAGEYSGITLQDGYAPNSVRPGYPMYIAWVADRYHGVHNLDVFGIPIDPANMDTQNLFAYANYTSSNPSVATVRNGGPVRGEGSSGAVRPLSLGQTVITANLFGMEANITVVVYSQILPEMMDCTITSPSDPLKVGDSFQCSADGRFWDGSTNGDIHDNVTPTVEWVSTNTSVVTFSATGNLTAQGPGTVLCGVWSDTHKLWRQFYVTVDSP